MFAMLDKVFFTVVGGGMVEMQLSHSATFVDHEVFVGKPQTQAIGLELDELSLGMYLHYQNGQVSRRIKQIKALLDAQKPVPYVMGNGRFVGTFTLRKADIVSEIHDDRGGLLAATLAIELKEYAGKMPDSTPLAGIVGDVLGALGVSEEMIGHVNTVIDTVETAISMANEVMDIIDDVTEVVNSLKTSSNPLMDLLALGGVFANGKDFCEQIFEFEFPKGEIFDIFKTDIDKTGGFFGGLIDLANKAAEIGDLLPFMNSLDALSDNLTTMGSLLPVDTGYIKAEVAGREL